MSGDPIEIVNLRKVYKGFAAVDDLTFSVKKNSFTGFLGPNGSGKSTTLKVLTHLINATSGEAYINGTDVTKDPKKALTGVGTVVETPEFYLYLTPNETFRYVGQIIGMKPESIKSETGRILEMVKMTEWADKRLGTFSKGMRQRVALGLSLLNDPSVIILDEPTSGLDPRGMAEMREILKNIRLQSNGLTVVMSSHMLYEVSDLCDRIVLINHGKMILEDDTSNFGKNDTKRRMTVKVNSIPAPEMISKIAKLNNVVSAERFGNDIDVTIDGGNSACVTFFDDLSALRIGVYGVNEEDALEATYLRLIKESR
ncbi:trehalose/maltose import ATP-binding protein MalK [Candidatus Methanoplasma termitum]|uniref:MalK7 protein n=1 Tax=Candidatus Methanoplasma termitum TaxID=1577791 RepID=A0A0A7LD70_9ARCH|nr:ABC transporter ATP-binding protein [Candidatus Methanoplasma termitum]AIZ56953.1 trehalose/maltose import ATP-binding protein MalK [Candidatus Methanoplasma termitum]MCL2333267.1 ABC transporter ATP-binding protein [Candidatus Methanoplasma sp.]